jgi:hypothetical protein
LHAGRGTARRSEIVHMHNAKAIISSHFVYREGRSKG